MAAMLCICSSSMIHQLNEAWGMGHRHVSCAEAKRADGAAWTDACEQETVTAHPKHRAQATFECVNTTYHIYVHMRPYNR